MLRIVSGKEVRSLSLSVRLANLSETEAPTPAVLEDLPELL